MDLSKCIFPISGPITSANEFKSEYRGKLCNKVSLKSDIEPLAQGFQHDTNLTGFRKQGR